MSLGAERARGSRRSAVRRPDSRAGHPGRNRPLVGTGMPLSSAVTLEQRKVLGQGGSWGTLLVAISEGLVMTVNYRNDSDRMTHQVWAQRQASSCAVASIWMARNQAKQMTFAESEWALAWRIYNSVVRGMILYPAPPPPMSFAPSAHKDDQATFGNMFSRMGTYMDQVARALVNDGLKVTHKTPFVPGTTVDPSKLSDTKPAIVLLGWYNGTQRNGGHFIVASRKTRSGKVVYLDPWGAPDSVDPMRYPPGSCAGSSTGGAERRVFVEGRRIRGAGERTRRSERCTGGAATVRARRASTRPRLCSMTDRVRSMARHLVARRLAKRTEKCARSCTRGRIRSG